MPSGGGVHSIVLVQPDGWLNYCPEKSGALYVGPDRGETGCRVTTVTCTPKALSDGTPDTLAPISNYNICCAAKHLYQVQHRLHIPWRAICSNVSVSNLVPLLDYVVNHIYAWAVIRSKMIFQITPITPVAKSSNEFRDFLEARCRETRHDAFKRKFLMKDLAVTPNVPVSLKQCRHLVSNSIGIPCVSDFVDDILGTIVQQTRRQYALGSLLFDDFGDDQLRQILHKPFDATT